MLDHPPAPSLPSHLMEIEGGLKEGWLPFSFRMEPEGQKKVRSRLFRVRWGDHRSYLRQGSLLNFA